MKPFAYKLRFGLYLTVLSGILIATIIVAAGMGYMKIPPADVLRVIWASITGNLKSLTGIKDVVPAVIVDVRLPRIFMAAIVGGGLALAGSVFQGILLNPLADPYTLGVSAGAAFGAAIAILLNIGAAFVSIPGFAFAGAVLTLLIVIFLSTSGRHFSGRLSSNNLILSGIIVSAILSAGLSFLKYLADEQVSVIIFWLMGSFSASNWHGVLLTALACAIGLAVSIYFAKDLNLISLGNRSAATLGVDIQRVTLILLVISSLVAAVCVSVSGIIGFVGLLIPHMVRLIVGPDNLRLIPLSFISGAILLLWADTLTRAVLPSEIPIGVLTALIGGPVFCYIFSRGNIIGKSGKRG